MKGRKKRKRQKLLAQIAELNARLSERTTRLLDQHAREKQQWQSRPCMATASHPFNAKGNGWDVDRSQGGHVFAWMRGAGAPGMQYLNCIGCGKPYHVLYPWK